MYINERFFYQEMINKDMCTKCGGKCCKKYPCAYYPSDFKEMNVHTIKRVISDTDAVIDIERYPLCGDKVEFYYLFLRPRGERDDYYYRVFTTIRLTENGIMDNRCVHLQYNGCDLGIEKRPGQGLYLIPEDSGEKCYLSAEGIIEQEKWYKDILNQQVLYEVIESYGEQKFLEEIPGQFILKQR